MISINIDVDAIRDYASDVIFGTAGTIYEFVEDVLDRLEGLDLNTSIYE